MGIHIISTKFETNEGFEYQKPDREILDELVKSYNDLARYVALKNGMIKDTWSDDYVE